MIALVRVPEGVLVLGAIFCLVMLGLVWLAWRQDTGGRHRDGTP